MLLVHVQYNIIRAFYARTVRGGGVQVISSHVTMNLNESGFLSKL